MVEPQPAFPELPSQISGMTLRDYFAARALVMFAGEQALHELAQAVAHRPPEERVEARDRIVAARAYCLADAMLAARKD